MRSTEPRLVARSANDLRAAAPFDAPPARTAARASREARLAVAAHGAHGSGMGRNRTLALAASVVLAGLLVTGVALGDPPACIDYRGESRYQGAGYAHVVIVRNGCDRDARCEVWTDVTPEKQRLDVPSGQEREVVTRIGSPAYAFTPHASCELAD